MKRPIAVFTPTLNDTGGTERATLRCIRDWSKDRRVTVYCRDLDVTLPDNVEVVTVRLPGRPALVGWPAFLGWASMRARRLRRLPAPPIIFTPGVNLVGADLTVAHIFFRQYRTVLAADAAARGERTSRWMRRMLEPRRLHGWIYGRVVGFVEHRHYARSRFVLAVSELMAAAMRARGLHVEAIAPNGVDLSEFDGQRVPRQGDRIRVLCVGSEIEKKGLDVLVEASSTTSLRDRVSLTIVTRPSNAAALHELASRTGFAALRVITTSQPAKDLFRDCDIYVAPSREDSFNMPALEAMASRVPVALSTRCGLSELATPSQAALSIEPSVSEVTTALLTLIDDPAFAEEQAARGFELARTCSWDVALTVIAEFLETLDSQRESPGRR